MICWQRCFKYVQYFYPHEKVVQEKEFIPALLFGIDASILLNE